MSGSTKANDFDEVFNKVLKEMPKEKFVVYPDPQFSIEELIQHKKMVDDKNATGAPSVKTPEELKLIVNEIDKEVATEVAEEEVKTISGETVVEEEKKELTEEEKRAKLLEALKASHQRYHPRKAFGTAYKQERKRKNRMQKKSRKSARKK
jgi:hypothetical protein